MSRLDRLITLLENGSVDTRKAAAFQIGDIIGNHPDDLHNILPKIAPLLFSAKWETRVAARHAFESIANNYPASTRQKQELTDQKPIIHNNNIVEIPLTFEEFDLVKIIASRQLLLATADKEFDTGKLDKKDLAKQRSLLKKRLELDFVEEKQVSNIVSQNDLEQQTTEKKELSAREKNVAKRKAKQTKQPAKKMKAEQVTVLPSITIPLTDTTDVLRESVTQVCLQSSDEFLNPFQKVATFLFSTLFHAHWEIRHGSALALREIFKKHSRTLGMKGWTDNTRSSYSTVTSSSEEAEKQHLAWCEDSCVRLLVLLSLDRFGDFTSDKLVAPVRETCCQMLSALTRDIPRDRLVVLAKILSSLQLRPEWEVRLSGFLGLKYILAVHSKLITELLPSCANMDILFAGLIDVDDDVKISVVDIFSFILHNLPRQSPTWKLIEVPRLLTTLWDSLVHLDELSTSAGNIIELLGQVYSLDMDVKSESLDNMEDLLLRLSSFLSQKSPKVKLAALKTLDRILVHCGSAEKWVPSVLSPLATLLLDTMLDLSLYLESDEIPSKCLDVWKVLTDKCHEVSGLFQTVPEWCQRVLHAEDAMDKRDLMLDSSRGDGLGHVGVKLRTLASKAIASVVFKQPIKEAEELFKSLLNCLNIAVQLQFGCFVIADVCREATQHGKVPELSSAVASSLLELLEIPSLECAELEGLKAAIQNDAWVYIQSLQNLGVEVSENTIKAVSEFQITEQVLAIPDLEWDEEILNAVLARQKRVIVHVQHFNHVKSRMWNAVQCAASEAVIQSRQIPNKVTSIIRPLMISLKDEISQDLQQRSAVALSGLIEHLLDANQAPAVPKVVSNLCALATADSGEVDITVEVSPESCHEMQRGSVMCLRVLAEQGGPSLFDKLHSLGEAIFGPLQQIGKDTQQPKSALKVLGVILPTIHKSLHTKAPSNYYIAHIDQVIDLLPRILDAMCLDSLDDVTSLQLSDVCASTVSIMAKYIPVNTISFVFDNVVPLLQDIKNPHSRLSAVLVVTKIAKILDLEFLPYCALFVLPLLGAMSDHNNTIRSLASKCFGKLMKLLPIESGIADPTDMPLNLKSQKKNARQFAEQLVGGSSKVEPFAIPVPFNATLRSYQQAGVNWLAFLNKYSLHGCLCDDMGLGKTLQTLCIVASDTHLRRGQYAKTGRMDVAPLPSLIVTPSSVIGHWNAEVEKFFDQSVLSPFMYAGSSAKRVKFQKDWKNIITQHNIIITSYETVRTDNDFFASQFFNYCVLDEGHVIKNPKTKTTIAIKSLKSVHRLILTGTPIQNNALELWSLFDYLMPGFLGTEKEFNDTYTKPIMAAKEFLSVASDNIQSSNDNNDNNTTPVKLSGANAKLYEAGTLALEALHKQVLPFILRRLKSDVLQDLPPKIIQDLYCQLSPLQLLLYQKIAKEQSQVLQSMIHSVQGDEAPVGEAENMTDNNNKLPGKSKGLIGKAVMVLRKLCTHPLLLMADHHTITSGLNHVFVDTENGTLTGTPTQNTSNAFDLRLSPKFQALKELLNECGIGGDENNDSHQETTTHRVVIFAQLTATLDLLESVLFQSNLPSVSYLRIDGSTSYLHRQAIIQKFTTDPTVDVLLCSTRAGGLGINLTAADTVVMLEHDWNPMADLQAMDRAHRIGARNTVNVYRIIMRGTIEEKMMSLQQFKKKVANTVVNQDNTDLLRMMDTNQLLDLFHFDSDTAVPESVSNNNAEPTESKKGSGLKAILDSIGELWDETQYQDEYDVKQFVESLK